MTISSGWMSEVELEGNHDARCFRRLPASTAYASRITFTLTMDILDTQRLLEGEADITPVPKGNDLLAELSAVEGQQSKPTPKTQK